MSFNFLINVVYIISIKYLKIKSKDITITSLPISYVYGLSVVNTHLLKVSNHNFSYLTEMLILIHTSFISAHNFA